MISDKIKLLNKIDDLLEVLDVYKPFKDKKMNGLLEWKLLLAYEKVKDGSALEKTKADLEQLTANIILKKVQAFHREMGDTRVECGFVWSDDYSLYKIELFLFRLIKSMRGGKYGRI